MQADAQPRATSHHDLSSGLWGNQMPQRFFPDLRLTHRVQVGGSCVSTGLSLLTREAPGQIRRSINTQDPVSWSCYLMGHGMKLAYCNTDLRRLKHYVQELLALDDLFALSTYSPTAAQAIGTEPRAGGWVCSSHFTLLHRDTVYDTRLPAPVLLRDYPDCERYVKRMFRIVPLLHPRGL
jgi:hypothetical protein